MERKNVEEYIEVYEREQVQKKLTTMGLLILLIAVGTTLQSLFIDGSWEYLFGKIVTAIGAIGLTFYITQTASSLQRWWDARKNNSQEKE